MRGAWCIFAVALFLLVFPFSANREPVAEQPVAEIIDPDPISAYDDLIRATSAVAGVDWRLVSAIIYHESRFHNKASSGKGAVGLMQVRSARYENEALLDPATNIAVGARYLRRMQKMFSPYAADTLECLKFSLAAYNAGEGRILKSIDAASADGLDSSRWDEVCRSTTKPPSSATIAYVDGVLDKYREYALQFPPTSSK